MNLLKLLAFSLLLAPGSEVQEVDPPASGVLLGTIEDGSFLSRAGLQVGDHMLSWRRSGIAQGSILGQGGSFASPLDWSLLVVEGFLGEIELEVARHGSRVKVTLPPGDWSAPVWPGSWDSGTLQKIDLGRTEEKSAAERALEALEALEEPVQPRLRAWTALRIAEIRARLMDWEAVEAAIVTGRAELRQAHDKIEFAQISGSIFLRHSKLQRALKEFDSAIGLCREESIEDTLLAARGFRHKAEVLYDLGRLDEAIAAGQLALAIQEMLTPGKMTVADTRSQLGLTSLAMGRYDVAEEYFAAALEIASREEPGSMNEAEIINNLGLVNFRKSEYGKAGALLERSLEIKRTLVRDELKISTGLQNLAVVQLQGGAYDRAEANLMEALEIRRRLAPGGVQLASTLMNLGALERLRFNLSRSRAFYMESLNIRRSLAEDNLETARLLGNLADLARFSGDLDQADRIQLEQLEILERLSPEHPEMGSTFVALSAGASRRGDLELAGRYLDKAMDFFSRARPGSPPPPYLAGELASLKAKLGDDEAAERWYRAAIAQYETENPAGRDLLNELMFYSQFLAHKKQPDPTAAAIYVDRAIAIAESMVGSSGLSGEERSKFRSAFVRSYKLSMELNLSSGRMEEAFDIIERSRGREVLELLAVRSTPGILLPAAESGESRGDEESLRRARDSRVSRVLRLRQIQQNLHPKDLILSFVTVRGSVSLFAVGPDHLSVHRLNRTEKALEDLVSSYRSWLERDYTLRGRLNQEVRRLGRELGEIVLGPVSEKIAAAEDILVIADRPLYNLPFGALVMDDGRFLIEGASLHFASSASVAQSLAGTPEIEDAEYSRPVIVFGDVVLSGAEYEKSTGKLSSVGMRGPPVPIVGEVPAWRRLPFTRREALGLMDSFDNIQIYLGSQAREDTFKMVAPSAGLIHIATHGDINEAAPLESGLILNPEGTRRGEDGILRAREILQLDLDSDLVFLSACQSALGKERLGEGLLGLTLAFQLAGARSVSAALWSVDDEATSVLTTRFYRHLKAGLGKAHALRAAQMEMLRGEAGKAEWSAPYYWAAFQLYGDWR